MNLVILQDTYRSAWGLPSTGRESFCGPDSSRGIPGTRAGFAPSHMRPEQRL